VAKDILKKNGTREINYYVGAGGEKYTDIEEEKDGRDREILTKCDYRRGKHQRDNSNMMRDRERYKQRERQ
jgi:hypothetical protein